MKKIINVIFIIAVFCWFQTIPEAYSADWLNQIHPYISVSGEYSDNLDLTKTNKKEDFMTTVRPGIKFNNMDSRSGVNLDASAGYVFYSRYNDLDYLSANVNLDAKYLSSSHFNFYIKNAFIRSDDPWEREYFTTTADNKYVLARETGRSVYLRNVVEPMVEYQFGQESRIGVKYRNNYYRAQDVANNDSVENYGNAFLNLWFNKQHGISLDYGYTNGYFQSSPDLNSHRIGGAYMFRFMPRAIVSLKGAYTKEMFTEELMDYEIYDAAIAISYQLSQTLTIAAEGGYYWMDPRVGSRQDGPSFKVDITQLDQRTTYILSLQGGYTQDYFTSQNLGFQKYYRATGSITHYLERRLSVGLLGSIEYAISDRAPDEDMKGTIWSAGANVSYIPLKWLTLTLQYGYREARYNQLYEDNDYKENRVTLTLTATY